MEKTVNITKYILICLFVVLGVIQIICVDSSFGSEVDTNYKELKVISEKGTESDIAFFEASKPKAVILSPGARFSKESWYFIAERFQRENIASVSLNTSSTVDIINGYEFLKNKGFERISLIGASMGGVGVLEASNTLPEKSIDKIVVIAPFGGNPIKTKNISKLFIVAEDDMMSSSAEVYSLFDDSSEPKMYKEYSGSAHAQMLFETKHKEALIETIIDFIKNE